MTVTDKTFSLTVLIDDTFSMTVLVDKTFSVTVLEVLLLHISPKILQFLVCQVLTNKVVDYFLLLD